MLSRLNGRGSSESDDGDDVIPQLTQKSAQTPLSTLYDEDISVDNSNNDDDAVNLTNPDRKKLLNCTYMLNRLNGRGIAEIDSEEEKHNSQEKAVKPLSTTYMMHESSGRKST